MAVALKPGTRVRLVQPVIEGEIIRADTNGEHFGYQVRYTGPDGEVHERFLAHEQLQEVQE